MPYPCKCHVTTCSLNVWTQHAPELSSLSGSASQGHTASPVMASQTRPALPGRTHLDVGHAASRLLLGVWKGRDLFFIWSFIYKFFRDPKVLYESHHIFILSSSNNTDQNEYNLLLILLCPIMIIYQI